MLSLHRQENKAAAEI